MLIVVGSGGGTHGCDDRRRPTTSPSAAGGDAATFAGIPQHGDTLGEPNAPVTMIVFEDPQCPFCGEWNVDTLPTVIDRLRPDRARQARLPRHRDHRRRTRVAGLRAIYAAGRQNKLWNVAEALYAHQGDGEQRLDHAGR